MIGILGGTFDPIHFGHLRTALDVMQVVGLDEVRFIPLHSAVHRDQPETAAELRLQMVEAAIAGQAGFVADDRELRRQGDSYTVDTLVSLHRDFPGHALCLLLGMDAFNGFATWRQPEKILSLAHLIVMRRPGETVTSDAWTQALLAANQCDDVRKMRNEPAGRILIQELSQLDISSTKIRSLIAAGLSPRYLLPEGVMQIIDKNSLYLG
ncbi:MAG: nicotinate-nucleotide adenylyltransferase [Candidatus Thiodiazotropha sp. (ex Semelilucina semeliformis)]|nr:nicotinate-nucleotide adenylyltransferase [Candidatus Thiodiazotropha sp. (ex Semelilucina semeliformis)]MCU7828716.1 nicotinate-nucleotide adenylyltransferase [Candidatus Thiodiazotropha sp. (ex Myrtea sp. 'scaly one' KF741663)]